MLTAAMLKDEHMRLSGKLNLAFEKARKASGMTFEFQTKESELDTELSKLRRDEQRRIADENPGIRQEDLKVEVTAAVADKQHEVNIASAERQEAKRQYDLAGKEISLIAESMQQLRSEASMVKFEEAL